MKITKINVPAGVRYLSDWAKMENGYHLSDYRFPHIVDKQITGCGFTEYCIREKGICEVICSPRRILLENKADQHRDRPNVIYFKNDVESLTAFDKDLDNSINRKSKNSGFSAFIKEKMVEEQEKTKQEEDFYKLESLKGDLSNKISALEDPDSCKILVTYDSFRHVKDVLKKMGILDKFFVVVDEFQSIFVDAKFKSNTEIELLNDLKDINNLCYVSATPMLEKYLDMLDEFKELPYYSFDWGAADPGRVTKPDIEAKSCKSVLYEINNVVKEYKDGLFESYPYKDKDGNIKEVISNEAVIYVNSVKHICNIIKSSKLTIDETNVLCARTPENERKIKEAFRVAMGVKKISGNVLGHVPVKGERHKMFTLCTRTVYLGADFYSTCARTFIASDSNVDSLSVDISLDLPQILGRQRLEENPWKNRATLYYKTICGSNKEDTELFKERIKEKTKETEQLLNIYNGLEDKEQMGALAKTYQDLAALNNYKENYVAVNKHAGSCLVPVFNNLVLVADIRTYEVQQLDFRDRVTVLNTLSDNNFNIVDSEIDAKVKEFNSLTQFQDKMRLVCTTGFNTSSQQKFLRQLPVKFEGYYNVLGPERIKELSYRNDSIKSEYDKLKNNQSIDISGDFLQTFIVGERYSLPEIKQTLEKIYTEHNYKRTPKAVDLKEVFEVKSCSIFKTLEDGTKQKLNGFEILSIKSSETVKN